MSFNSTSINMNFKDNKVGRVCRPLGRLYADFCSETTIHGMKHTVAEDLHWFERFLWFILTISAFAGATYCALSQLTRYNSEPVVVSTQRNYRTWWSTFPAVTACFVDRIDVEKAKQTIEMHWNVTEESDPEKYQYYYGFIELVSDVSFRTNLQNFWKYQNDDTVKNIDLLRLALSVHPTLPLKVMTSVTSKEAVEIRAAPRVKTLRPDQRRCKYPDEPLSKTVPAYSFGLCQMHCRSRMALMFCGCRPFFHVKGDGAVCDAHGMACVGRNVEILINLPKNLAKCSCLPQCAELNYYSHTKKIVVRNATITAFLTCPPYKCCLKFCMQTSLGGTTALFVGASVLTVVETGLFFIRKMMGCLVGRRRNVIRNL